MSNRRLATMLGSLLAILAISSMALAGLTVNTKKGKVFFKNQCRVCHDGKSESPPLTPMTKTIAQWEKAFAKGGPVLSRCSAKAKEKSGTALTEQDLADIRGYLVAHAADSDQPATCGN